MPTTRYLLSAGRLLGLALLPALLLSNSSANSQTTPPATKVAPAVCFSQPVARQLLDSLRHLPTVRREAQEWQRAYVHAKIAADTNAYAANHYHQDLLHSQVAFSGQQLLLGEQRAETAKFRHRAHVKGWLLTALLAGLGGFIYWHP